MTSNKLIVQSQSRNPSLSTSSSACTILLSQPFYLQKNQHRMRLKYFLGYNTISTITTYNQNFQVTVSSTTYLVTIPTGCYTALTLATAIATALTAAVSNTWTCTYSSQTNLMTITGTTAFVLNFNTGTSAGSANNIWRLLGFASSNGASSADSLSGTSSTGTQGVNLSFPLLIYMNTNIGTTFVTSDNDSVSFAIPNKVATYDVIEFSCSKFVDQYLDVSEGQSAIRRLDFTLCDRFGQALNLNGSEWIAIFEFSEY